MLITATVLEKWGRNVVAGIGMVEKAGDEVEVVGEKQMAGVGRGCTD